MDGLTVAEIARMLGILPDTVKKRLRKAGIMPSGHAGPTSIYPRESVDAIRDTPPPGRPKKV